MIHYNEATNISDILAHFRVSTEDLQKVLNESLSKGGDYADLFFEHTINHNIALRDGEVNRASSNVDYGVGVRVVVGDQTGYAYVENTTLEDMLRAARTAAGIAKMSHHDNSLKIESTNFKNYYKIQKSWEEVSVNSKKEFVEKLNSRIFELDTRVVKASVSLSDSTSYILFFNSEGVLTWDYRPMAIMYGSCTMEDNGKIENGYSSRAYRKGFEFLNDDLIETLAREAVEQTSLMFKAIKPKGGEMPVVMGAGSSGILLHEAIGHAFEADFNRKNVSIFSDLLGKKICNTDINVVDDGTIEYARGAINFDDEGVESQKTYIVRNGVLESYLHDRISAKYYGLNPTGNGRRQSFRYAPMPRMRVTYMESGTSREEDMIAQVKQGVYVDNFSNGQVQIGAGDFTFFVKTGYLIENGKLTQPIKDINIIGNGPKALADITMVGNNLRVDESAWTCGKDGQSVPVGQGLPSVLVSKLTVGGE
ncbi:TldD/PmbA family protein [Dysgonomonas macrotermitis]|uniref:TldD protein n=1 Tax=Dysgonomonas macrotermitis TaxID=1346286 RepID=A0A1M4ZYT1_9BACT|nr:TldD/PmbA family protein [Dysgonomonas macrotermitis]SHF23124.1 microcin-processing peptidase 2. Unknown type peptidase. MEROPS family U62 [Dysgonomonas macrotermitis]